MNNLCSVSKRSLLGISFSEIDLLCPSKKLKLKENSKPWIDSEKFFAFCKGVTFLGKYNKSRSTKIFFDRQK